MKYKIRAFDPPQVTVEYSTDDDQYKMWLNVRIDRKLDGTLPQGEELDSYILSFAPNLGPQPDPYEGVDWSSIESLVDPIQPTTEELAERIRLERNFKLSNCDWTVLPDSPLDNEKRQQWEIYRQVLRDITTQPTFPNSVIWPTEPV